MKIQRRRTQLDFKKPSRTKQAFKDECDVNQILSKYQKTQNLTHVNNHQGNYGDFTNASDYQDALNSVMAAQHAFDGLSASTRKKFNNSPASFVDFISDNQNYEEALKLGLLDESKSKEYLTKKIRQQNDKLNDDLKAKSHQSTPPLKDATP